nr:MAG TPA: Histone-like Protein p6 [Caudoviricetes sp.]
MERANVLARKEHKGKQVAVTGVSTETKTYFMTLEDFIKYASEVTEDEEMEENGGNE